MQEIWCVERLVLYRSRSNGLGYGHQMSLMNVLGLVRGRTVGHAKRGLPWTIRIYLIWRFNDIHGDILAPCFMERRSVDPVRGDLGDALRSDHIWTEGTYKGISRNMELG